jgi:hypothetical protein
MLKSTERHATHQLVGHDSGATITLIDLSELRLPAG